MAQNPDRRSIVYSKALDLFIQKGYSGTSVSMIAKALGMSKANLYYYCSSKENLLYQIHLDFLQKRFIPVLEEAEKLPDPADRIALFLRKFTLLNTSSKANRVLVHEVHRLDGHHHNEVILIWKRAYDMVRDALKELQRSGKAPKQRISFQSFMWIGMVFWVVYWFDYSRQANAEELAEIFVQTFRNSMTPQSPSGP